MLVTCLDKTTAYAQPTQFILGAKKGTDKLSGKVLPYQNLKTQHRKIPIKCPKKKNQKYNPIKFYLIYCAYFFYICTRLWVVLIITRKWITWLLYSFF